MSIKEIIEALIKEGYKIEARKRHDGGYLITKINGESFRAAKGNARARLLVGAKISNARHIQLQRIRFGHKKMPEVPNDLKKLLRKVQREWRKKHPDIRGTLSMRGLRYYYSKHGTQAAFAAIDKHYRYAQGLAYIENVNWLVERLHILETKMELGGEDTTKIKEVINKIESKSLMFKEEWIHKIYEIIYMVEEGLLDDDELVRRINLIIQ